MPDGSMSPEKPKPKSSVDEFRKAGPTPEQMKEWQGPEWKSELPDIRMQIDPDEFLKRMQEREGFERSQGSEYDKGRTIEAIIARHPNPETVRYVLRVLQLEEETFNTNGEPDNRFEVAHRVDVLRDRGLALRVPIKDITKLDLVEPLNEEELELVRRQRGKTIPIDVNEQNLAKSKHVEGFGLNTYSVPFPTLDSFNYDKDGEIVDPRYRMSSLPLVYLGKDDEEREGKSKKYFELKDEVTARHLMMQLWGHHVTYYYALQKLAEGHYFGSTLSSEGLGVLFNQKGLEGATKKTETGVELRSLGDKVETAMRLYYVAALCEKPTRFRELMDSPGWRQFLFPVGTPESVIEEWIGKPDEWEKETQEGGQRDTNTLKNERAGKLRGRLTQKNIFAESDTYVEDSLNKGIQEFLGGGEDVSYVDRVEAENARRIGFRMFRLFLLADQEGYELLKDSKWNDPDDPFKGLDVVFENAPAASDFGKLTHPDLYAAKSRRKGRDFMPKYAFLHSKELYPRFMVDFLRHAVAKARVDVIKDGVPEKSVEDRSLMERWWGYRGGLQVTRGGHQIVYQEEPAVRLGDMPWLEYKEVITLDKKAAELVKRSDAIEGLPAGGYHHEAYKTLWLTGFMFGGEGRAHQIVSETGHNPQNLMDVGWWRKFWKMLDVGVKDGVALNGVMRGTDKEAQTKAKNELKVNIIRNFVIGLQGLPSWEEWRIKEIEIYPRGGSSEKKPSIAARILQVANEALEEEGVNYRLVGVKELQGGKIEAS